ncbi:LysR substrate-binding domain-containing protein [Mesorhizobium sp. VK23B]|uniref:LysR substrate-binding domain-containing protein n=1 Tax=Mesorhizobium dulcispinae TaxID=3072316 RepID=A0ABU4X9Q9_9HYPH|nr:MULTISPECIES: LysR substrate-binding domain-containing protein [unclassified Mesorhizobium]MDX8465662.1 LysR substrate-binding domain-containing protein [Mesorhizobium sp. VK23B]MDX8471536.1 LysR substrate-binding domain-containing protein [Mesorhizobium sp. VK23A]
MVQRTLPPLTTLRAFEAAARLMSFKAAAEELRVTQSAISHQVASLERNLGTPLFLRLPGRVELSEEGAVYFPVVQDALDRIALTTDLIRQTNTPASLTVQVYVTVAVRWLIPRFQTFKKAFPEIAVNLDASLLDWEFNPDRADIGFIYTRAPNRPNLTYTLLRRERLVGVCSPAIARAITAPEDLRPFSFLAVSGTTEDAATWAASVGATDISQKSAPLFDSNLLAIEAAINGQGVVVVPLFLVEADIAAGTLVAPLASEVMQPGGWYLVHLERRRNEKAIREFLRWIQGLV